MQNSLICVIWVNRIWNTYTFCGNFEGMSESKTQLLNTSSHCPPSTRYLRFNPTDQVGWNCLSVELYGTTPPKMIFVTNDNCFHSQRVTTLSFQQNSHCMPRSYLNLDTIIQSHYPLNYLESNFSLNNYNTVAPNRPLSPKNLSKRVILVSLE